MKRRLACRILSCLLSFCVVPALYAASLTWDADLGTAGAQDGAGTWDLVGTNWFTGGLNATWRSIPPDDAVFGSGGAAGTIELGAGIGVGNISFGSVSGSYAIVSNSLTLSVGSTVTVSTAQAAIASPLTGAGATLTKEGAGTLILTGGNSYNGPTTVNDGVLQVGNGAGAGTLGTNVVTVNAGAVVKHFRSNNTYTIPHAFSGTGTNLLQGTGARQQSAYLLGSPSPGFTGTLIIDNARLQGTITNAGNPTAVYCVDNGTNGGTIFGGGDLAITIAGLGWWENAGRLGALRVNNNTWSGPITLSGDARITSYGGNGNLTGPIAGEYELELGPNQNNGQTITITPAGTNTYASTRVNRGTVTAGNAEALSSGPLTVLVNGTLNLNGHDFTFAELSGTGGIVQNNHATTAVTMTVNGSDADTSFAGVLADGAAAPLSLVKIGTGMLALTGGGSFTGGTTVSNGTLRVLSTGAGTGFCEVNGGARLEGSGQLGAVTMQESSELVPDDDLDPVAEMEASSLTLEADVIYEWNVRDFQAALGDGSDVLTLGTTLDIGATSSNPVVVKVISLQGTEAGDAAGFGVYTPVTSLLARASSITGYDAGDIALDLSEFSNTYDGAWSLQVSGGNLELVYAPSQAEDPITAWTNSLEITFCGYDRDETLTNFPALIVLSPYFFNGTNVYDMFADPVNGHDLRFATNTSADSFLPYEIEKWDSTGNSYVWVQVPELATDTPIYLMGGNTNAVGGLPLYATDGSMWDDGYMAVYHFADGQAADSLGNYHGTLLGGGSYTLDGRLGNGLTFDGVTQYLDLPDGFADFTGGITVETWVRFDTAANYARIIDFGNGANVDNVILCRNGTSENMQWDFKNTEGGVESLIANTTIPPNGIWGLAAATCAPGVSNACLAQVLMNGVVTATNPAFSVPPNVTRVNNYVGESNWPNDQFFQGAMDELRISNVERSTNWLWASYLNQAAPATFYCVSGEGDKVLYKDEDPGTPGRQEGDGVWDMAADTWLDPFARSVSWQQGVDAVFGSGVANDSTNWVDLLEPVSVSTLTFATGGMHVVTGAMGSITFPTAGMVQTDRDAELGVAVLGSGFTKSGPGALTLGARNTYFGDVTVEEGILRLGHVRGLPNNARTVVKAGAMFDYAGYGNNNARRYTFEVEGVGTEGQGVIINSGAAVGNNGSCWTFIQTGDVTVGGEGRWDIGTGAATTRWDGGGYTLTKVGQNEITARPQFVSNVASIVINEGIFKWEVYDRTNAITATLTNIVNTGGILSSYGLRTFNMPVVFNDGTLANQNNWATWTGPMTVNGSVTNIGGQPIVVTGSITGGTLVNQAGNLYLAGTNTYGDTLINGGTVWIGNGGTTGTLGAGPVTNNATLRVNRADDVVVNNAVMGTGNIALYATNSSRFSSVSLAGTLQVGNNAAGPASLLVGAGDEITVGRLFTGQAVGNAGNIIQSGGVLTVTDVTDGEGPFRLGHWSNETSTYSMVSGELYVTNGTSWMQLGIDGTGVWNLDGGTATVSRVAVNGRNATGGGILNFSNGVLRVGSGGIQGNAPYTVNLAGGMLTGYASWSSPLAMTLTASAVPLEIDTTGGDIALSGALTGTGGFAKAGDGTMVLAGANTYEAATTVMSGLLLVDGSHSGAGAYAVDAGGALWGSGTISTATVTVAAGGYIGAQGHVAAQTLSVAALALDDGASAVCVVNGDTPTVDVTGTLTTAGTCLVDIVPLSPLPPGTYTLIRYGTLAGDGFGAFVLTSTAGGTLSLNHNIGAGTIELVVGTVVTENLAWSGKTDALWDYGTTNWVMDPGGADALFDFGDGITFDDNALGNFAVSIARVMAPGAITVNNTANDYSLGGAPIVGAAGLYKSGSGMLTLSGANAFSGPLHVGDGVVVANTLAAGGMSCSLGAQSGAATNLVLDGGALRYTGPTVSVNRMFTVGAAGGVIDVDDAAATLTIDGAGWDINGTLVKRGPGTLRFVNYRSSFADADTDIIIEEGEVYFASQYGNNPSATTPMRIIVTNGATLRTRHRAFTELGGNDGSLEYVTVERGSFWMVTQEAVGPGIGVNGVTLRGGAILAENGACRLIPARDMTFRTLASDMSSTCAASWNPRYGPSTWILDVEDGVAAEDFVQENRVYGNIGVLHKNGEGRWVMKNRLDPATVNVNAGTLALGEGGSYYGTTLNVATGAVLDVSGVTTTPYTLLPGRTLAGGGAVTGEFATAAGSTVSPGGTDAGTLTFSTNLTLSGCALPWDLSEVDTPGGGTNDGIVVQGDLVLDGTNTITILPIDGAPFGEYTLFEYGGAFVGNLADLVLANTNDYRQSFALDTNEVGKIRLLVTGAPGVDLLWSGGTNGTWDIGGDASWNTNTEVFYQGDTVLFDDEGGSEPDVTIDEILLPASVVIDTASNYMFTGSGRISGVTSLIKDGSGTLTVATTNDFVGGTRLRGGVTRVGVSAALGSGAGGTFIEAGAALGAGDAAANALALPGIVHAAGSGPAGDGAIVNTSANAQMNFLKYLVLDDDTSVGGTQRWDVRGAGGYVDMQGHTLTKVGPSEVHVTDVETRGGTMVVEDGLVDVARGVFTNGAVIVNSGGDLRFYQAPVMTVPVTVNGGRFGSYNGSAARSMDVPITLNGTCTSYIDGGDHLTLTTPLTGPGSLTATAQGGGDILTLAADCTYGGGTVVQSGVLRIGNGGETGSVLGDITDNATLEFRRSDSLTLTNALTGTGSLWVNVVGGLTVDGSASIDLGGSIEVPKSAVGSMVIETGAVIRAQNFFLGNNAGSPGTVTQQAGTVELTGTPYPLRIGHWPNEMSTYVMAGGQLDVLNGMVCVGWDGFGTLIQTGGEINARRFQLNSNGGNPAADGGSWIMEGGRMSLGVEGIALPADNVAAFLGGGTIGASDNWTWDAGLSATLTGTNGPTQFDPGTYTITLNAALSGDGGLLKQGEGTLVLAGTNTYAGGTSVQAGVLQVGGSSTLADDSEVRIVAGGVVSLDTGVNETVRVLFLDGVQAPAGTWGSGASAADFKDGAYFGGSGVLTVTEGMLTGGVLIVR